MSALRLVVALVDRNRRVVFWGELVYERDGWTGIRVDGEGGRVDEAPTEFVIDVSAPLGIVDGMRTHPVTIVVAPIRFLPDADIIVEFDSREGRT